MKKKVIREFFKGENPRYNACLNFSDNMHYGYIEGYLIGANILARIAVETHQQDFLVYPVLFCYRHHLEIQLKSLIEKGAVLLGKNLQYPEGHVLGKLWKSARNIPIALQDANNGECRT